MSLEQLEQTVLNLPREERRRFANWFYRHEGEIFSLPDDDEVPLSIQAEVLRRSSELDAHPELAVPVTEQWFDELKRKLADAPARQARPR